MNRKVTVVGGAGNVGATVARSIAEKELADVVIIDIAEQKAAGVALDILETCPIIGSDSLVIGGSDYAQSANSDVVVITSGVPRKPGMSRDDLLSVNFGIMKAVTEQVVALRATQVMLLASANPVLAGQAVTFTATVSAASGTGTPTGAVTFMDGDVVLAKVALQSGQTTLTWTFPTRGSHTIKAVYSGATGFLADKGCYIIDSSQFDDLETGLFFMRLTFTSQEGVALEEIVAGF